jgi:hypothetical protein
MILEYIQALAIDMVHVREPCYKYYFKMRGPTSNLFTSQFNGLSHSHWRSRHQWAPKDKARAITEVLRLLIYFVRYLATPSA